MFGTFPPAFFDALEPLVAGRRVLDLGAGDGVRAMLLRHLGAAAVLAIDGDAVTRRVLSGEPGIEVMAPRTFVAACFDALAWGADVAHVAWPWAEHSPALRAILHDAPTVVYVGKNTDGTACGAADMFEDFLGRPVLAHVPTRANTLIAYGPPAPGLRRAPLFEEACALDRARWRAYDEAAAAAPCSAEAR